MTSIAINKTHNYNTRGIRFNYADMDSNPILDKFGDYTPFEYDNAKGNFAINEAINKFVDKIYNDDPDYEPTEEELWLHNFELQNDDLLFEQNVDLDFNENEDELSIHDTDTDTDLEDYDDESYVEQDDDEEDEDEKNFNIFKENIRLL
jgi:hypothetical protein